MSTPSSTRSACFLNTQIVPAVVNIADNYTYSTDDIISGFIQRSPNGAARSDTLPSAAALISGFKTSLGTLGATITNAFVFMLSNESSVSAQTITLSAGSGMTLKSTIVIGPQQVATLVIHVTSSSTVELYATSGTSANITGSVTLSGTLTAATINDTGLLASRAVVTDASKNLASLPYTALDTTVSALMERDANGNAACSKLVLAAAATVPTNDVNTLDIQCQNATSGRKFCLFSTADNVHQYYGFGIAAQRFEYHVDASNADHVYYSGASTTTSNELGRWKGTGGLVLPTTGGTASSLTYYEEALTQSAIFQGIWSSNQTASQFKVSRIGNIVVLTVGPISSTANTASNVTLVTALPAKWRPPVVINTTIVVLDNGTAKSGLIQVGTDGSVSIYASITSGNFAGAGASGFQGWSITYGV